MAYIYMLALLCMTTLPVFSETSQLLSDYYLQLIILLPLQVYFHNTESNSYLSRVGSEERPFISSSGQDLFVMFETGPHNVYDTFKYIGIKARYEFVAGE